MSTTKTNDDIAAPSETVVPALDSRTWPTLKRLLVEYILPHWKLGSVAVVAMLAVAATQTGVVALVRPLLDDGFVAKDAATIRFYAIMLIVFVIFQGVMFFVSQYLRTWISRTLVKQLRKALHDSLLVMPVKVFDQMSSGRLVSKLTYEAEQVANSVIRSLFVLVQNVARIIFLVGYMIYLAPLLTLIVAAIFPLLGALPQDQQKDAQSGWRGGGHSRRERPWSSSA